MDIWIHFKYGIVLVQSVYNIAMQEEIYRFMEGQYIGTLSITVIVEPVLFSCGTSQGTMKKGQKMYQGTTARMFHLVCTWHAKVHCAALQRGNRDLLVGHITPWCCCRHGGLG